MRATRILQLRATMPRDGIDHGDLAWTVGRVMLSEEFVLLANRLDDRGAVDGHLSPMTGAGL